MSLKLIQRSYWPKKVGNFMAGSFKLLCEFELPYSEASVGGTCSLLVIMFNYDALHFNIQIIKLYCKIIPEIIMFRRITIYAF